MGWYEDMERAGQERDTQEYECAMAYKNGYNKAIDDCVSTVRTGMEELLKSPWCTDERLQLFSCSVREVFKVIDLTILERDIESMKKGE